MKIIFLIMMGLSLLHAELTRDSGTGIVNDSITGLEWQDNNLSTELSWLEAIDVCENLVLGTRNDWRLPNINELKSIVNRNRANPAIKGVFVNTNSNEYWSSTTYSNDANEALLVNFDFGNSMNGNKSFSRYVRCVRAGE